jgi:hypothetical protein
MILLRPICWLLGHKRGTFDRESGGMQIRPGGLNWVDPATGMLLPRTRYFRCPRCDRQTRYKVKSTNQTSPADGSPHHREAI